MGKQFVLYLILIIFSVESSVISDDVCQQQLQHFESALAKREHWALYGELFKINFLQ